MIYCDVEEIVLQRELLCYLIFLPNIIYKTHTQFTTLRLLVNIIHAALKGERTIIAI